MLTTLVTLYDGLEPVDFADECGDVVRVVFEQWEQSSQHSHRNIRDYGLRLLEYDNPLYFIDIPITGDVLDEETRAEVENFIRVYESHLKSKITEYLQKLADSVGVTWAGHEKCLEALARKMFDSKCLHAYASDELCKYPSGGHLKRPDGWERHSALTVIESIYAPIFSGDTCTIDTCTIPVFVYGDFSEQLYTRGHVFVPARDACEMCDACRVLKGLHYLTSTLQECLPYWYLVEVYEFLLRQKPLSNKVGRLRLTVASPKIFWLPSQSYSAGESTIVKGGSVNVCPTPQVQMDLLPVLPPEVVSKIYRELTLSLSPKLWALLHFVSSVEGVGHSPRSDSKTRQSRGFGELRKLLHEWNRVAPVEWRLENSSSRVQISRMLKKIRESLLRR